MDTWMNGWLAGASFSSVTVNNKNGLAYIYIYVAGAAAI